MIAYAVSLVWGYIACFAIYACVLLDRVIVCTRRLLHAVRAFVSGGVPHTCYVASWRGPPRPGVAGLGQLRIVEVIDEYGRRVQSLTDANYPPDMQSLERDVLVAETYILDATLYTDARDGGSYEADVTKLMYSIPHHLHFTPTDLAILLWGRCLQYTTTDSRLVVQLATDEPPFQFNPDEPVGREVFFSNVECNCDEAHSHSIDSRGDHTGSPVRSERSTAP